MMMQNFSDLTLLFVEASKLDRHLLKVWIYKDKCVVVDFSYSKVRFSFDITPSADGLVSLDLLQKNQESEFRIISDGERKRALARNVPLREALELLRTAVNDVFAAIDAGVPPGESSIVNVDSAGGLPAPAPRRNKRPKPMKVGVLTLPFNANIGGNLQGYALIEVLRRMGHQPVLINRRRAPKGVRVDDALTKTDTEAPLLSDTIALSHAPNRAFIEKHIAPISREFYSTAHLGNNVDQYEFDAIVVGSDQVWRPKYAKSILFDFFMKFLPEENTRVKRISYAASFGTDDWEYDTDQTAEVASLIKRFSAVSVREDSGVGLCRDHLGVEARHVLDPTLLLTPEHYARLFSPAQRRQQAGQLLAYILDRNEDKTRVVEELSRRLSISPYSTTGLPFGPAIPPEGDEGDASVEGWLAAIQQAAFVVTDSFHGAVFSILFNKPFIAYGNPKRGMARFVSLMRMLGLEDRLVVQRGEIDVDRMLQPIDWAAVNRRLERLRGESQEFLTSALAGRTRSSAPPTSQSPDFDPRPVTASVADSQTHPLKVLCTGCGVCVSESKGSLRMVWSRDGFLVPEATSAKVQAEAIRVCPFNPLPDKEVEDEDALAAQFLPRTVKFDPKAGRFENSYIGYSKEFRTTSSSGGLATYVFHKLLEQKHVDYIFVVKSDGKSGYEYRVVDRSEEVVAASKTRYYPVTMENLFDIIGRRKGRVAVSGVACFIKAIRLKQNYHPELKEKIPFLVGIICGGLKSRLYTDFLSQSAGIEGSYVEPEYRVKDPNDWANHYSFSAVDNKSERHSIKMGRLGDMWGSGLFKSKACDFCTDVLTELADISVGDAWLPAYKRDGLGNSVVVTRSALADQIIQAGIRSRELNVNEAAIGRVIQSQNGGFNHKHHTLSFRTWMYRYFTDEPVPVIRSRLLKSISVPDAVIQIYKGRTRSKSLAYWNKSRKVDVFGAMMRSSRLNLKTAIAARKEARESGRHPLSALLMTRRFEMLKREDQGDPSSRIMARWLKRKTRGSQFQFDIMRAAVLEANVVHAHEEDTKPATAVPTPDTKAENQLEASSLTL